MLTPMSSGARGQGLRRCCKEALCKSKVHRLVAGIVVLLGALVLFSHFVVPQLVRFRFRYGMSWYDLGYYGFGPSHSYVSFHEESPSIDITPADAQCDPRYTFIAPRGDSVRHPGPMILDANGELVWTKHNQGTTQDFKVQEFNGERYLTYWQGDEEDGHGVDGAWYMVSADQAGIILGDEP